MLNEGRPRESPGQQPDDDRSRHEKTVPVQTGKKRKALISVKHNLHGPILPWRFRKGIAADCGAFGTALPQGCDQGQKMSFDSANTISDRINASPPAIRTRSALSDGGRPVTASKA